MRWNGYGITSAAVDLRTTDPSTWAHVTFPNVGRGQGALPSASMAFAEGLVHGELGGGQPLENACVQRYAIGSTTADLKPPDLSAGIFQHRQQSPEGPGLGGTGIESCRCIA